MEYSPGKLFIGFLTVLVLVSSVECQSSVAPPETEYKNITITIRNQTLVIRVPASLTDQILEFINTIVLQNNITTIDIDVCVSGIDNCTVNETCVNIVGIQHMCLCKDGFSRENNSSQCTDTDECALGNSTCHLNATCENKVGGYDCVCNLNFTGDGTVCTNACTGYLCNETENCKVVDEVATCECKARYELDGDSCIDIDECAEIEDMSGSGDGASGTSTSTTSSSAACPDNEKCVNSPGNYSCVCESGFDRNGTTCTDIDECASNPCHRLADCSNTDGSFQCECKSPFIGNGSTCGCENGYKINDAVTNCTDIDECVAGTVSCPEMSFCQNSEGSYTCPCNSGFRFDGSTCIDNNECTSNPCHHLANCTNTHGSFQCACKSAFVGDGSSTCGCQNGYKVNDADTDCIDINECTNGTVCTEANSQCNNTDGSYTCECARGFTRNGTVECVDENECDNGMHNCTGEQECKNTNGSFTCDCSFFNVNGRCLERNTGIIVTTNGGLSRKKRSVTSCDLPPEELASVMSKHLEEFVEKYTGSKINVNVTSVQSAMGTYTFIVSTDAEWINHVRVAISQLSSIRVNDTCTVTFRGLLYTKPLNYVGMVSNETILNDTICDQVAESVQNQFDSKFSGTSIVTCNFTGSQLSFSVRDTFAELNDLSEAVMMVLASKDIIISDINECADDICLSVCTNTIGSFTCRCPNGTFDLDVTNPGRTCVHPIKITCGRDGIRAEVYIAYFENQGVRLNDIHLYNKSCLGTVGSQFLTFDFKFDECDTRTEHGNNTVVYFNAVTNKDNWTNVYSPSFTAELRCSYSNEFNSTDSNDTTSATITATILIVNPSTGNGDLKVTLSLLKDDAPLQTTDELRVGDLIQIKVTQTGPGLFMKVTTCWATPTSDPTNNPYEFITNECPTTDRNVPAKIVRNGNNDTALIEVQAFSFADASSEIFLHCQVKVCESPCQKDCETSGRRKRQTITSQEPENMVSIGPILVTGSTADIDDKLIIGTSDNDEQVTNSNSAVIGTSVSLGIAICIIIGFVVYRKFKKDPNRESAYHMAQWN